MARPGPAAARRDRGADSERRVRGFRDRALRQGSAVRTDHDAGDAGISTRTPPLVADLCSRRAPWPADRHSPRLDLPPFADLAGVADLLSRGLYGLLPGVPVAADEPHQRGCVCEVPRPQ